MARSFQRCDASVGDGEWLIPFIHVCFRFMVIFLKSGPACISHVKASLNWFLQNVNKFGYYGSLFNNNIAAVLTSGALVEEMVCLFVPPLLPFLAWRKNISNRLPCSFVNPTVLKKSGCAVIKQQHGGLRQRALLKHIYSITSPASTLEPARAFPLRTF